MVRCRKCHRVLKNPEAQRKGIGPVCERKEGAKANHNETENGDQYEPYDGGNVWIERYEKGNYVGGIKSNVPRQVVRHSPAGYNFGYGGSGPADFAWNVLLLFCKYPHEAELLHQDFKWKFIAVESCDRLEIPREEIEAYILKNGAELK
jgi:hypothetical protein